jgi:hypothetical protein
MTENHLTQRRKGAEKNQGIFLCAFAPLREVI